MTIGIDVASSRASIELAEHHSVYASAGLHPNSALGWDDATERAIEELVAHDRVVAVGETGLDFYRDAAPPEAQEVAFRAHIALAKSCDKTLVIHTRHSIEAALDTLEDLGAPPRLVFHCWSGDEDHLKRALALGSYVSFAGNVSYKSAGDLRAVATLVPSDRLLVETDSPYLAPVPHRGKPNEPAFVADVGAAVAEARGESVATVAEDTSSNARRLFGIA